MNPKKHGATLAWVVGVFITIVLINFGLNTFLALQTKAQTTQNHQSSQRIEQIEKQIRTTGKSTNTILKNQQATAQFVNQLEQELINICNGINNLGYTISTAELLQVTTYCRNAFNLPVNK